MKYKVGDVVVIRPDLRANYEYGGVDFVSSMERYLGCEATIMSTTEVGLISIDLDGGEWNWSESMFCGTKAEYEARNDWSKRLPLDMLDNLLEDPEVCVSVKTKEDSVALFAALQERGFRWSGWDEHDDPSGDRLVTTEDTRWDDFRADTVYFLSKKQVDWGDGSIADEDEDYDYIIKYTFQSVRLDDFELPSAGLLLM